MESKVQDLLRVVMEGIRQKISPLGNSSDIYKILSWYKLPTDNYQCL